MMQGMLLSSLMGLELSGNQKWGVTKGMNRLRMPTGRMPKSRQPQGLVFVIQQEVIQ